MPHKQLISSGALTRIAGRHRTKKQAIDFYEAQQQGDQVLDMCNSSSEGSCPQTMTSRTKDCRPLTAKELQKFDKEVHQFFKNHKRPIGS